MRLSNAFRFQSSHPPGGTIGVISQPNGVVTTHLPKVSLDDPMTVLLHVATTQIQGLKHLASLAMAYSSD